MSLIASPAGYCTYSSVCCCTVGIMAGSPCPPELLRKIISVMGIKGITVSENIT